MNRWAARLRFLVALGHAFLVRAGGVPITKLQRATSKMDVEYHAWIFISHASDDLVRVREIRNYLESKGASPLLFHLKALANPEEFWPIIEREIAARNFFLYCQSAVADEREWVRRERAAVEAAGRERPIRVDSIRVDGGDLDFTKLDAFIAKTRVFPSYATQDRKAVLPFAIAMGRAGFQIFSDAEGITAGENWGSVLHQELEAAARNGWVVVFVSQASMQSTWVKNEISAGVQLGAKFIPVLLEKIELPADLPAELIFDATDDPTTAPDRLVELMLRR